jgi:hypothetical protein
MYSQRHLALLAIAFAIPVQAQLGLGWKPSVSEKKLHLNGETKAMVFDWKPYQSNCSPTPCVDYRYDSATETETFRLLDNRTNRSEIRLLNEYSTGSRQFEGYVTFFPPLNDESLMQVWGSSSGATQLMVRGFAENGGSIKAQGVPLIDHIYGKEVRVNVIHMQEDVGNTFAVYIDGVKKTEFRDGERVTNYHKYGCYGSLKTKEAVVKWRSVKHFEGGTQPTGNTNSVIAPRGMMRGWAGSQLRIFDLNGVQLGQADARPARQVLFLIP